MSGYYLMHRGWLDHPALGGAREPFCRRAAWAWMIEQAQWQDGMQNINGKSVMIRRGQFTHSLRFMAKAWGWDDPKVRRFIARLIEEKMIDCVADAGQTVITICNYDKFQVRDSVGDAPSDAAATQQRRSIDANKKEGKEDTSLEADASRDIADADPIDAAPNVIRLEKPNAVSIETLKAMGAIWREVCGDVLPVPRGLDRNRQSALRRRFVDTFSSDMEQWRAFCQRVRGSPFLTGENQSGWRADLDFMLKPKNANKLLEGGYDDRRTAQQRDQAPDRQRSGSGWAAYAQSLASGSH